MLTDCSGSLVYIVLRPKLIICRQTFEMCIFKTTQEAFKTPHIVVFTRKLGKSWLDLNTKIGPNLALKTSFL